MSKKRQKTKKRRILREDRNHIKISSDEIKALIERIELCDLSDEDKSNLRAIIEMVEGLNVAIDQKRLTLKKLVKLMFGDKSEKIHNILKNKPVKKDKGGEKKKGSGKNGSDAYKGANRISVSHLELKPKDRCPLCLKGKVYPIKKPSPIIRITGNAPISATIYECERLRCNLCGEIFKAAPPDDVGDDVYDEKAKALIPILKYGSGMPFYRLEGLQSMLGIPLPDATQWDIVNQLAGQFNVLYEEYLCQAAYGFLYYIDDTNVKILDLKSVLEDSKNKGSPERKGLFTSGILCEVGNHSIALYFSGNQYAGENLDDVLSQRPEDEDVPISMSDGLAQNKPKNAKPVRANCNTHARRKFVEIHHIFPDECIHVLKEIGRVYKNDRIIKESGVSAEERLTFHQENSAEIMSNLKAYLDQKLSDREVEPNSALGGAMKYMLNRWTELTRFLTHIGAPLDNNICEQMLKRAILHRKNSLFYKTKHGAYVGDMMMSFIHTCYLNQINPLEYFVALQKNIEKVKETPSDWMPWNYEQNLSNESPESLQNAAS